MAGNDGTLKFDTKIDGSGFQKGLDHIGGAAQKGLSATAKVLGGGAPRRGLPRLRVPPLRSVRISKPGCRRCRQSRER